MESILCSLENYEYLATWILLPIEIFFLYFVVKEFRFNKNIIYEKYLLDKIVDDAKYIVSFIYQEGKKLCDNNINLNNLKNDILDHICKSISFNKKEKEILSYLIDFFCIICQLCAEHNHEKIQDALINEIKKMFKQRQVLEHRMIYIEGKIKEKPHYYIFNIKKKILEQKGVLLFPEDEKTN